MPLPQTLLASPAHRAFLMEYIKDFNQARAWQRAGHPNVSMYTASEAGNRVLKLPKVRAMLALHLADAAHTGQLTLNRVLREYMRLGLSDIRAVVTLKDGKMTVKDTEEWSDDAAAAVSEVTQVTVERGKGDWVNTTTTLKVKLHSKAQAMEGLAKHLDMFRDIIVNNNLQLNVSISDLAKLVHPDRERMQGDGLATPLDDDNRTIEGEVSDEYHPSALDRAFIKAHEGPSTPSQAPE